MMKYSYENLKAWQVSINLAKIVYDLTKLFPKEEKFGITTQMRKAAVSISSNIAEGSARESTKEYIKFIRISLGSLSELESQLILSEKLGYINAPQLENVKLLTKNVGELIGGLKRYLCSLLNENIQQTTYNKQQF